MACLLALSFFFVARFRALPLFSFLARFGRCCFSRFETFLFVPAMTGKKLDTCQMSNTIYETNKRTFLFAPSMTENMLDTCWMPKNNYETKTEPCLHTWINKFTFFSFQRSCHFLSVRSGEHKGDSGKMAKHFLSQRRPFYSLMNEWASLRLDSRHFPRVPKVVFFTWLKPEHAIWLMLWCLRHLQCSRQLQCCYIAAMLLAIDRMHACKSLNCMPAWMPAFLNWEKQI